MACRAILAILSVSVLVARGSAVLCTIDLSDPCKCSYIDERDVTWVIDISNYFQYPYSPKSDSEKYAYTYTCQNAECPRTPSSSAVACQYIVAQAADYQ